MTGKPLLCICLSILGGALILGGFIFAGLVFTKNMSVPKDSESNRYEMVAHEYHLIIFDNKTGAYWDKAIDKNTAPTEWQSPLPRLGEII